jgi:hypothetical protein
MEAALATRRSTIMEDYMSNLRLGMAALVIACTAGVAVAQTTPPPADATTPPANMTTDAPKTDPSTTMNKTDTASSQKPPLSGANSFTEAQARQRIAKAGFDDVQQLKKDDEGIWRGQAKKSGQQVSVALDYRGNVVQQ